MKYQDWLSTLPKVITDDVLWRVEAYRLALFAADLAWHDGTKLLQDKRTIGLADQLNRAAGSTSANLSEGYSRQSHKDQARYYEYSLGSARETRNWYYLARHVLQERVTSHRLQLHTQIVRLLLTMIPNERSMKLSEDPVPYLTSTFILTEPAPLP